MQDVGDEINDSVWCELGYRLVLDPLGKLVDCYNMWVKPPRAVVNGPNISRLQQANGQDGGMVIRL
jgi:hypothetical protein